MEGKMKGQGETECKGTTQWYHGKGQWVHQGYTRWVWWVSPIWLRKNVERKKSTQSACSGYMSKRLWEENYWHSWATSLSYYWLTLSSSFLTVIFIKKVHIKYMHTLYFKLNNTDEFNRNIFFEAWLMPQSSLIRSLARQNEMACSGSTFHLTGSLS